MDNNRLDKDLIADPSVWDLAIRIEADSLKVVLHCKAEQDSLITRTIPLDPAAASHMKAVEDALYDNPLLLDDFRSVTWVSDSDKYVVIPADIDSADTREKIFRHTFPEFDGHLFEDTAGSDNALIIAGIDQGLYHFLKRSYYNLRLIHILSPLSHYFLNSASGYSGHNRAMLAHFRQGKIDLVATSGDGLLLANTFIYTDTMDAVYYILASFRQLGFDAHTDPIAICGEAECKDTATSALRQYIASVMPVIFPSTMFRAGKDAMKAPFDLIILPLCE